MDIKSITLIAKLTQDSKWNKYIKTKTTLPYTFLLYSYGVFLIDESSIFPLKKTQQERLVYDSEIECIYIIKDEKLLKLSPREFKGINNINQTTESAATLVYGDNSWKFNGCKLQPAFDGSGQPLIQNPMPAYASPIPREIKNDIPAYDFK